MMRSRFAAVLAILVLIVSVVAVAAHAELVDALPEPGAALAESPTEIRLTFSEPVGPQSEILLFGEGFRAIDGVEAQNDPADPTVLFATLPVLDHDTYTVQWSVVSDDGHEIGGTYSFGVGEDSHASAESESDDHSHDTTPIGTTFWSYAALGLIGGGLLLILAQRFLKGA